MLNHLEQATLDETGPVGMGLDQGDELARARVMSRITELGEGALVDPFVSFESLVQISDLTKVDRARHRATW